MSKKSIVCIIATLALGAVIFAFAHLSSDPEPITEIDPNPLRLISPTDAKTLLTADPTITLLDVRTEEEFAESHIPGAILIPYDELSYRATKLPKNSTIIIYCRTGARSQVALQILLDLNFTSVYDLGGILYWPYETIDLDPALIDNIQ